ncbi:unnamed protein product [Strongylus vulgaris]|uniref:Uncharacterized protein n=1 Tax=Strongylus vulgaris TaxID=40348 RepID=A0A3P7IKS1_STRVU|nr:unnamed protein product [Strongylus vulgaris]
MSRELNEGERQARLIASCASAVDQLKREVWLGDESYTQYPVHNHLISTSSYAQWNSLELGYSRYVTAMPLMGITVAGKDSVHQQVDGINCGVFACAYAERLARGD